MTGDQTDARTGSRTIFSVFGNDPTGGQFWFVLIRVRHSFVSWDSPPTVTSPNVPSSRKVPLWRVSASIWPSSNIRKRGRQDT